jgi:hypothetical protein
VRVTRTHTCMHVCVCVYIYIYMYIYTHTYWCDVLHVADPLMCVHVHTYIHTYIYTCRDLELGGVLPARDSLRAYGFVQANPTQTSDPADWGYALGSEWFAKVSGVYVCMPVCMYVCICIAILHKRVTQLTGGTRLESSGLPR